MFLFGDFPIELHFYFIKCDVTWRRGFNCITYKHETLSISHTSLKYHSQLIHATGSQNVTILPHQGKINLLFIVFKVQIP